jgi:hypothetical protein
MRRLRSGQKLKHLWMREALNWCWNSLNTRICRIVSTVVHNISMKWHNSLSIFFTLFLQSTLVKMLFWTLN